jgi:serine/threonine-protein kinase
MDNMNTNVESGIMLENRYEILEKIGAGGMSDVFLAKDHSLGREVAVKILKQEFAEDRTFVAKFRAEAQAAAGLEHPNIVSIYDVGSEGSLYYIVMEYVEGITLKTYINKKGRLTYNEALSIAIQVGRGIEAAHKKNIIHRDIKPQNIIISREGKVKVMDFGIARAVTSNTVSADIMGSVHYASPEQARNGYVTFTTDIYSLGIVMYEMVTGRVPYDGETTVAIAIQHLQGEMVPPSEYAPDLPIAVERIIQKATMKTQSRRYQTMGDMLIDLKKALANPNDDFVVIPDADENMKTRVITDEEMDEIQKNAEKAFMKQAEEDDDDDDEDEEEERPKKKRKSKPKDEDEDDDEEDDEEDDDEEDDDDDDESSGREKVITVLGIIAAIVIVIIIIVIAASSLGLFKRIKSNSSNPSGAITEETDDSSSDASSGTSDSSDNVTVPSVIGMNKTDAKKTLKDQGLGFKDGGVQSSDDYEEGLAVSQDAEAGSEVKKNTTVTVKFSSGKGAITIPSVVGYDEASAINTLTDAGFKYVRNYDYSDTVETGKVISQSPEGNTAGKSGDTITIIVSQGKEQKKVPSIVGKTQADAESAITAAGLVVGDITEVNSDTVAAGSVIEQDPATGTNVDSGSPVNFVISLGKEEVYYSYSGSVESKNNEKTTWTLKDGNQNVINTWSVDAGSSLTISANGMSTSSGTLFYETESGQTGSQSVNFTKQ